MVVSFVNGVLDSLDLKSSMLIDTEESDGVAFKTQYLAMKLVLLLVVMCKFKKLYA